jgi:hypothetical protein
MKWPFSNVNLGFICNSIFQDCLARLSFEDRTLPGQISKEWAVKLVPFCIFKTKRTENWPIPNPWYGPLPEIRFPGLKIFFIFDQLHK